MSLLSNPWMNIGLGLLSNSGPSYRPVNPYRGIAEGLFNAQQGKMSEQDYSMNELKLQQEQASINASARQQQLVKQLAASQTDPQQSLMAEIAPAKFVEEAITPHPYVQFGTAGDYNVPGLPPDTPVQIKQDGRGNVIGVDPVTIPNQVQDEKSIKQYKYAVDHDGYQGTYQDFLTSRATKRDVSPYYSFLPTDQGYAIGNNRTGDITTAMNGTGLPYIRAQDSPDLQGRISEAKGAGTAAGTIAGTAAAEVPAAQISADRVHGLIEGLRNDPGLGSAVGGMKGLVPAIPGTEQGDFINKLDQATNNAFMEARTALKGGGQITDYEGKKAESAIARMKRSTSKKEFLNALDDFDDAVEKGMSKLKARAGGLKPGHVEDGYKFKGGNPADPANWTKE